jgi:NAD(P)-dependent dehydrogenase (short-subunit alcohol dehydrogenase family)
MTIISHPAASALAQRSVLITGANRGLGRALVDEALRRGARRVYAATRTPFAHPDGRVTMIPVDLTDTRSIEASVARVDGLDVLVNNAALGELDGLEDHAVLERHLAVNVLGLHAVTEAFRPMLRDSRGRVVNVLSVASLASLPVMAAYSSSKAAAFSLTQSYRALLAGEGVRVHAVLGGPMDTDMVRDLDIPKASVESVAGGIYDGVERGEEDIFPDPLSMGLASAWRDGPLKALERGNAAYVAPHPFTTVFTVDRTPAQVFDAINDVRRWWAGDVDGVTDELDAEFTYRSSTTHVSRQRVVELVPGQRVVWRVVDSHLSFAGEKDAWTGTDIVFDISAVDGGTEVRFTHVGLDARHDCFNVCSTAWTFYIDEALRGLLTKDRGVA